MVVVDVGEIVGQFFAGRSVRFGGEVPRHLPDDGPVERRRLGIGWGQKPRRHSGYQRQRGSGEETPAIHETTSRLLVATLGNAVHALRFLISEQSCRFSRLPKIPSRGPCQLLAVL